ncbi:MAG TPA: proline iminopeptidase-family hydrolase [Gammaproteobacteria bacterium]|nr:proline iminopeptidase-family hydrolase [Gammaproteobacteria bacterium]
MSQARSAMEGYASSRGYKSLFRVVGTSSARQPLLCIHGGPGMGHDYLRPLEEMATTGRRVVFYDQLGCGGSDRLRSADEWSLELFLDELVAVRDAAGLDRCHVLGHGWGGMLALEYALRHPAGLESLVLSSAVASVPHWRAVTEQLVAALPAEVQASLSAHAVAGSTADSSYRRAADAFFRRHLCRMNPWPNCLKRSVASARAHPEARRALLGRRELEPAGLLADWEIVAQLGRIELPTLVVSGRYDLTPPPIAADLYQGIPNSEWVVYEHSANVPHLEEPERYLEVLDGFLSKVEDDMRKHA